MSGLRGHLMGRQLRQRRVMFGRHLSKRSGSGAVNQELNRSLTYHQNGSKLNLNYIHSTAVSEANTTTITTLV